MGYVLRRIRTVEAFQGQLSDRSDRVAVTRYLFDIWCSLCMVEHELTHSTATIGDKAALVTEVADRYHQDGLPLILE